MWYQASQHEISSTNTVCPKIEYCVDKIHVCQIKKYFCRVALNLIIYVPSSLAKGYAQDPLC